MRERDDSPSLFCLGYTWNIMVCFWCHTLIGYKWRRTSSGEQKWSSYPTKHHCIRRVVEGLNDIFNLENRILGPLIWLYILKGLNVENCFYCNFLVPRVALLKMDRSFGVGETLGCRKKAKWCKVIFHTTYVTWCVLYHIIPITPNTSNII